MYLRTRFENYNNDAALFRKGTVLATRNADAVSRFFFFFLNRMPSVDRVTDATSGHTYGLAPLSLLNLTKELAS
jgi:hypothetical protein